LLNNLQALRAFGALNVVLFHAILKAWSYGHDVSIFANLKGWGQNGVDIFFVISGFVMVFTQSRKPKSAKQFFINRVTRVVPIYWLLTSAIIVLFFINPGFFRQMEFSADHAALSFVFMSRLFADVSPLLDVGWTLEFEMLFYLLFSIGLLAGHKTVSFWVPILVLGGLVAFFGVPLIVFEFVLGMLAAKVYLNGYARAGASLLFIVGVALLLVTLFEKTELTRLFKWGFPSFLIILGAAGMPQIKTGLLTYLGAASYSIYLVQFFSIPLFYKVASQTPVAIGGDVLIIACLVASAAAGCLVYEVLEKPMSDRLRALRLGARQKV